MPYLRITCPELNSEQRVTIAERLTTAIIDLFYQPRGRLTREELRERTTVHFIRYGPAELFVGGKTPQERNGVDITVELSDWNMSVRRQRGIAHVLTPLLGELFAVPVREIDSINIRFHSYPPTDFAVGGQLLSDRVPWIGQLVKRLFG